MFAMSAGYFILLFLTMVFLAALARRRIGKLTFTALDAPIAAFLVFRILSTLTSVNVAESWPGLMKSGLLLAYYPLAHMQLAPARRRGAIYVFLGMVVVAAVLGVTEFGFGFTARAVSRTAGYTTFAEILAVAICLILARAAFARGRAFGWFLVLAASPLAALVVTFCRGQWLALTAGALLVALLKDRRLFWVIAALVAFAAVAAVFAPAGVSSGRFTLGDPAFENYRDVLWRGALGILFARPLTGFGPETTRIAFPEQTLFYSPVAGVIGWHNDFFQITIESGLAATAAAVWLAVASLSLAFRTFQDKEFPDTDRAIGLGLAAATTTVLVSGLVGNVVTDPAMVVLFTFLWGLWVPLSVKGRNEGTPA